MYAGAGNASTKLVGEVIGIWQVQIRKKFVVVLDVVVYEIENGAWVSIVQMMTTASHICSLHFESR